MNKMGSKWTLLPLCLGFLIILLLCCTVSAEKQQTTISVSVQPEMAPTGSSFIISGVLTDGSGSPIGNKRVILEKSSGTGTSIFESVAIINTHKDGKYQFFRGNKTPAEYLRVRFMGNDVYEGCVSEILSVHGADSYSEEKKQINQKGGVVITGDPDGALVILDGELRGQTPIYLGGIASGPHILEIGKPGFQNQTMEVYVAPDLKTALSYTLPQAGYTLENSGFGSSTGLNVFSNVSYRTNDSMPLGDPLYSFSRPGVSFSYYGNTSSEGANKTEVTTLYDEDPSGDGYSLTVLIMTDDNPS